MKRESSKGKEGRKEGRQKGRKEGQKRDGPANGGRGPPGHAGRAAHAQACRAERGPGEDLTGEPAAAGAAPGPPALALLHLAAPFTPQLAPAAATHDAQQQQPQAEALHRGTHMVGPSPPPLHQPTHPHSLILFALSA